jgi:hypothetical protein
MPRWLINRKVTESLRFLPDLMLRYDRSSEVDAADAAAFIKYVHTSSDNNSNVRTGSSSIIAAQKELLNDVSGWKTMPTSTRFQTMSLKHTDGDRVVTGRVVFRVSCSAAEVLAHHWLFLSNGRLKKHFEANGSLPYGIIDGEDSLRCRQILHQVVSFPVPLTNREFITQCEWEAFEANRVGIEGGGDNESQSHYTMAFEPAAMISPVLSQPSLQSSLPNAINEQQEEGNEEEMFADATIKTSRLSQLSAAPMKLSRSSTLMGTVRKVKKNISNLSNGQTVTKFIKGADHVRGNSAGFLEFKQTAPNQRLVTYVINIDLAGRIPAAFINSRAKSFLDCSYVILKFQRTTAKDLDKDLRAAFVKRIHARESTSELVLDIEGTSASASAIAKVDDEIENEIIEDVKSKLDGNNLNWTAMKTSNLLCQKYMTYHEDDPIVLGKASCVVDTSAEEALAWCWDYCSFERVQKHDNEVSRFGTSSSNGIARLPRRMLAQHSSSHVDILSCKLFLILSFIIPFE